MARVFSEGDVSGLLSLNAADLQISSSQVNGVLMQIESDVAAGSDALFGGNFGVDSVSQTQLQGTIFGSAPGQLTISGSGFLSDAGSINAIEFDPQSSSAWNWRLTGSGRWSEDGWRLGSIRSAEVWNDDDTVSYAIRGNVRTDANLNLVGTIKSLTVTAGDVTLSVKGSLSASDTSRGVLREVQLADINGNALLLRGAIAASAVPDIMNAAQDVGDLFDNATLLAGNDRLVMPSNDRAWFGFGGNDRMTGGDSNDTLDGGDGNDRINGEGGDDSLSGGAGNDRLNGGDGNDTLDGGDGNDRLIDMAGNNVVDAGAGNDRIITGSGDDLLLGGDGVDIIRAGGGNDTLSGGAGADRLTGGEGADLFWFNVAPDGLADLIRDFSAAEGDKLALSVSALPMLAAAVDLSEHLVSAPGASAQDGDDFLLFDTASRKLYYDSDADGSDAPVLLATLPGVSNLTANDFMLVS